jgi:hypothetical protein
MFGDLKETLNVSDFKDSYPVGFPNGAKEHGLGDLLEQLEEVVGDGHRVLAFLMYLLEEMVESGVHLIHQLVDPLRFKIRCHHEEPFAMGGMFDLLFSIKASGMKSNPIPFGHHFEMVWIGKDLTGDLGIGRGNRVTICFKLDKTRLTDGSHNDPIRTVGNRWKGFELLFFQRLGGSLLRRSMDSFISLDPPETEFVV